MGHPQRIDSLDILRAIAILLVMALHAISAVNGLPSILQTAFSIGWIGVDLFFVLSGFLIGRQIFTGQNESGIGEIWQFWVKRWTRTLPLYLIVLAFYALVKPIIGYPFVDGHWGFLFFFQNYMNLNDFVQSWSLCIEEQFYLFLPLLVTLFSLKNKHPLVWLVPLIVSLGLRSYYYSQGMANFDSDMAVDYFFRFKTHLHLDGLAMGLLLARSYDFWPRKMIEFKGRLLLWIPVIVIPLMSGYKLQGIFAPLTFTLLAVVFSLILVTHYEVKMPALLRRFLYHTSLYSYGIYLWNHVTIRVMEKLHLNVHWIAQLLIFFVSSYFIAIITYYMVEKPGLKLRKYIIQG